MSKSQNRSRVQILVDTEDRVAAESLTEYWYGLSLGVFLRLIVKMIAQEKLDITVVAKESELSASKSRLPSQ